MILDSCEVFRHIYLLPSATVARIGENIITDEQERAARLLEARTRRRRPQRLPVRSRSRVTSSIKSNYVIAHPFIHLINDHAGD